MVFQLIPCVRCYVKKQWDESTNLNWFLAGFLVAIIDSTSNQKKMFFFPAMRVHGCETEEAMEVGDLEKF